MNNRLLEFIQYKTGGKQADFAELMGWSPQYLHKLLKEGGIGIRPIISLLQRASSSRNSMRVGCSSERAQ